MPLSRRKFLESITAAGTLLSLRPTLDAQTPAPAVTPTASASDNPVLAYIRANWDRSIRRDATGAGQFGVDLPFPYTTPCIPGEGNYSFFFYWDTYFTNLGLLRHGRADVVRDNIRNMLWLVRRQGYMPNHVGLFNRSQPPYLHRMVEDYLAATGDDAFLPEAAEGLRQEYHFWMTARLSPLGLNQYGQHDTWAGQESFANSRRIARLCPNQHLPIAERRRIGAHYLAEAEASCDFTPRFDKRCLDHIQPELNTLLHGYETFFARHAARLGWRDRIDWAARADTRRELMDRHLWSAERGCYLDFDFANARHSKVAALTGFQPLAAGLATPAQAARAVANLPLFERAHGLAYTEDCPDCRNYQWAFPTAWPPSTWITVAGLRRYGYETEARRVAAKYLAVADRLFAETGRLWEKTDAESGLVATGEYKAPPMIGWCAGVYVALHDYLATAS